MFTLARIEAGKVADVIIAVTPRWPALAGLPGQWVDITTVSDKPGPGWTYDAAAGTFSAPHA